MKNRASGSTNVMRNSAIDPMRVTVMTSEVW
ncbi:Uncharacterised protein [Collinsella intestinalis]|nr:Uncharacterised protein [Collinsella intestinalis]